jgi:hypothetical protein
LFFSFIFPPQRKRDTNPRLKAWAPVGLEDEMLKIICLYPCLEGMGFGRGFVKLGFFHARHSGGGSQLHADYLASVLGARHAKSDIGVR